MNHFVAAIIHSLKLNSGVYLVINLCLHSVTNEVKMAPVFNIYSILQYVNNKLIKTLPSKQ